MAKDTIKKEKSDVVSRAKKFFKRAQTAEHDQRNEELDDIRFVGLLEQWPDNIRKIREADPQGARPCLTVDKTNQYKNQIVNNVRMNSPSIKVRPVDDNADVEVAEVYQGIIRHIEDQSHADSAYDWAVEGAVDSGLGYFRIITEYVGDSFEQEIRIQKIPNRFSCYRDPDSYEIDGSDQREFLITEMVNRDVFKEMYPDADPCSWESSTGDSNTWATQDEVRVAEYFYCGHEADELYLLDDGNAIYKSEYDNKYNIPTPEPKPIEGAVQDAVGNDELDLMASQMQERPQVINQRKVKRKVVKWAKLTGAEVLEQSVFPGEYIPVIPVFGIVTVVDGKMYWRGIIRGVKDAQRMYNYNRSTIAESLALTVKAPFIGATGQFKTASSRWASANRVNYAYLEYDPVTTDGGTLVGPPQRQSYAGVPTGLMADIQTSEHDIQSALGMYQASIGQDSNAKSGRALSAQKQQGDIATFHFPDNLAKSVAHAGKIIVSIIPKYYDTQRVVRILGEDGSQDFAQINPELPVARQEIEDENGAIKKIYNLGVGKYDVIATSGPSFATKRQEGAEFLTQVAQSSPDLMPVIGDLLFKSMDMPYADEVAKRMKKMLPPELKDEEGQEVNQEAEAVKMQATEIISQMQQQLEQASMAIQEREAALQEAEAKAQDNAQKQANEAEKLDIERFNAETERLRVELEAASKVESDERIEMLELAIARLIDEVTPEASTEAFLMPEV